MILEIGIALILAKLFGELFIRLKQPSVIGEIVAGIFIGAILIRYNILGFHHGMGEEADFALLANMGIILLMFISGFEMDFEELKSTSKKGLLTAMLGIMVPFSIVMYFGYTVLQMDLRTAVVLGTICTPTSVGVTVRVLIELGKLDTASGRTIIASAIIDDVIAIILISVVLGEGSLVDLVLGIAAFFVIAYILHKGVMKRFIEFVGREMHGEFTIVTIAIALTLIFTSLTEERFGLAAITGSFAMGILLSQSVEGRRIIGPVKGMAYALLVPIFFVRIGMLFDMDHIATINWTIMAIIPLAMLGKFIGSSIGARASGMSMRTSSIIGVGMIPCLEVELVILSIAISKGIFDKVAFVDDFASQLTYVVILRVLIGSLIIPSMVKLLYKGEMDTDKRGYDPS